MAFDTLCATLEALEARGRLTRVGEPVSPIEEAAALLDLAAKSGCGALLMKASGRAQGVEITGNLLHDRAAAALAFGVEPEHLVETLRERMGASISPAGAAFCASAGVDRTGEPIDAVMPVLKHYSGDSGPFITTGIVSARDPETGTVARGVHRMELRGPDRLGVALINPPLGTLCERAKEKGEKIPAAIVVGVEPLTFLGCALKSRHGTDKLDLAGGLRGAPVAVAPAPLTGIPVPAGSEFLLEGEIDPADHAPDGPLGEISGFPLSFPSTPTFRVRSIRQREGAVYHALSPAGTEADLILALVAESTLDPSLRGAFPALRDFVFVPSTFGSSVVVRVSKTGAGEVRALLTRLLTLNMIKKAVAVPEDVDPSDLSMVEWTTATRCQPDRDMIILGAMKGQPIDPSATGDFHTAKVAVDATGYGRLSGLSRVTQSPQAAAKASRILKGIGNG